MKVADAIKLVNEIHAEQDKRANFEIIRTRNILFNKGRYFEHSIYDKDLLVSMSKAIKAKIAML